MLSNPESPWLQKARDTLDAKVHRIELQIDEHDRGIAMVTRTAQLVRVGFCFKIKIWNIFWIILISIEKTKRWKYWSLFEIIFFQILFFNFVFFKYLKIFFISAAAFREKF